MAIQGHAFWGQWKGDKALLLYNNTVFWAHFLRCRRRIASKTPENERFYRPMHVVLARYCYRKSSVSLSVRLSVCP